MVALDFNCQIQILRKKEQKDSFSFLSTPHQILSLVYSSKKSKDYPWLAVVGQGLIPKPNTDSAGGDTLTGQLRVTRAILELG